MFAEEGPLMMFTLFSQLAVGSFLFLVLIRSLLGSKDPQVAKMTNFGIMAVGPIMGLALIFSLFHLGTPLGAYRSISNLGSSWLSREILTAGGFFVFWFVTYRAYKKGRSGSIPAILTSLLGLTVIFSMASIYASSIRPAWANVNTYLAFYCATFALGGVGATSLIAYTIKRQEVTQETLVLLKKVGLVAMAAVLIPLVYLPIYTNGLYSGGVAAQSSAQLLTGSYLFPLIIQGILSVMGASLALYALSKVGTTRTGLPVNLIYLGFVMVFIGAFVGRYVFYASAVSVIIGQS